VGGMMLEAEHTGRVRLIYLCGLTAFVFARTVMHKLHRGYAGFAIFLVATHPLYYVSVSRGDCGATLEQFSLVYLGLGLLVVALQHIALLRKRRKQAAEVSMNSETSPIPGIL
jgi:hypothetical protein